MPRFGRFVTTAAVAGAIHSSVASAQLEPARLRPIVEALAHDSAAGRRTPGAELDKAALYIAANMRAAGLAPLGDDAGFFQRYPVVESVLSQDSARIEMGSRTTWRFGRDFFYAGGGGSDPAGVLRGQLAIVTGRVTSENAPSLDLAGKVAVFLSPLSARGSPEDFRSAFALLGGARSSAVIIPGGRPDSTWKRLAADHSELMPTAEAAWPAWTLPAPAVAGQARFRPVLELWGGRWSHFVEAAGIDTAALRSSDGGVKVTSPGGEVILDFDRIIERVSWPSNVVGVLAGSDPSLRNEYVILTAHYDGLGSAKGRPPGAQSILNGADDNASGVATLIEIARAMSSGQRPKRSVIFAAVSGEENGLWGSDFLAMRPPVPVRTIVANVNMDMIGRSIADSVFVTGRRDAWLGPIANRALQRRSRKLVILDEPALERRFPGERADDRSDHANFRRRGIPAVSFFTGWHDDYHETTDDAAKLNYDALGRIATAVYDITVEIANAPARRP